MWYDILIIIFKAGEGVLTTKTILKNTSLHMIRHLN
jgi:hypothetical protein